MDIALGKEDLAFAERMRSFFTDRDPAEIRAKGERGEHVAREDFVTTQQILNAHGLAVPHWPAEWGGQDWTRAAAAHLGRGDGPRARARRRWRSTPPWSGR